MYTQITYQHNANENKDVYHYLSNSYNFQKEAIFRFDTQTLCKPNEIC